MGDSSQSVNPVLTRQAKVIVFLFALALAGGAEVLVIGDKGLLELGQFEETVILSAREFAGRF